MFDINPYFDGYLKYLLDEKEKFSYLQLTGKIEDYLVKEFCYYIYIHSKGEYAAIVNLGGKGENKIDISIITGNNINDIEIVELIEVKYFRNWHRFMPYDAKDNILTLMKAFNKQIYPVEKEKHGWFSLNKKIKKVKAMSFASFISYNENDSQIKEAYYKRILDVAKEVFFGNVLSKFNFKKIYEDLKLLLFKKELYITLRAGLWQ